MVICTMISSIYFDNAATTPLAPEVLEAMLPYWEDHFGNPSSIHARGREARKAVEKARRTVAGHFSVSPGSVIFTSGGTESNNMAIHTAVYGWGCKRIITSRIEHHSVLRAVEFHERVGGVNVSFVDIQPDGHIDLEHLQQLLEETEEKCLVTLMHANNETGNITDIRAVGSLCREQGAYFHSDCVQTIGHFPIDASQLPVDLLSGSGHKFHGPKGVGVLIARKPESVVPLHYGGNQERGTRAGTENVAGIVGFATALERAIEQFVPDAAHICMIKKCMMSELEARVEGLLFNGDPRGASLYTILNASFPERPEAEPLLPFLDQANIEVAGGSACSGGHSHVMEVLGRQDRINIRFSFSKNNTLREAIQVTERIAEWAEAPIAL